MTPERWRQVDQLLEAVLELEANERDGHLAKACQGDEALRGEVESLLAHSDQAHNLIESPPSFVAAEALAEERASPVIGRRLGHYEILALLGAGGMGEVYRARDTRLGREVAIKILPAHLADDPEALARFEREAKAVATLSHPNILAIHHFATDDGLTYAVMELLEGETLRTRLARSELTWRQAAEIASAISEGLSAAHTKGVVHRDLKPENVFLTSEAQVKILDFGLARLEPMVSAASSVAASRTNATTPGLVMGTPGYMSPEQVRGEVAEAPSDVFSLGCILSEMLTGRAPFARPTAAETIAATLRDDPPAPTSAEIPSELEVLLRRCLQKNPSDRFHSARPLAAELKSIRAEVSPELERIVGRALEKHLEERYATTGELLANTRTPRAHASTQTPTRNEIHTLATRERSRWGVGVFAVIATAAIGVGLFLGARLLFRAVPAQHTSVATASAKGSATQPANQLAVLPFRSFGQEQGGETSPEKVLAELIKKLTEDEQLRRSISIIPATDVLREKVTTAKEAITKFGATLVLAGNVIQDGDTLIVTAHLVDAQKQIVVNSVDFDTRIGQPLQESLAQNVARMLHVQLLEGAGALDLYWRGRGYLERYDRIENVENAIGAFEKALSRDRMQVLAHAGRAEAYLRKYRLTTDEASLDRARESVAIAMQLDDQLAGVHFAKGLLRVAIGDQDGAIKSFQRSLMIEPGPDATRELANSYDAIDQLDLAEETYRRAIQIRKSYWVGYKDLAVFYQKHGRLSEALPLFQRVVQLVPDNQTSYTNLGGTYTKLQRYAEASTAYQLAVSIHSSSVAYHALGTSLYLDHRYRDAIDAYRKAVEINPTEAALWGALGDAYRLVLGMGDSAVDAYRKAVELKEGELKIRPRDGRIRAAIASWSTLTDKRRALREIERAQRLSPRDARVQATAASVYEQIGMRNQAIAAVEQALKLGYSLTELRNWPALEKLRLDLRYKRLIATAN